MPVLAGRLVQFPFAFHNFFNYVCFFMNLKGIVRLISLSNSNSFYFHELFSKRRNLNLIRESRNSIFSELPRTFEHKKLSSFEYFHIIFLLLSIRLCWKCRLKRYCLLHLEDNSYDYNGRNDRAFDKMNFWQNSA